ncbi:MAG: glycosyltransferase [Clostridium sp.]|nr:glycosyltransferase [Clostridium sp.]
MSERSVSFIIVNYNGLQHLEQCFDTIGKLNYSKDKVECIMVDNGSTDGSVQFVEKKYPHVKIIKNDSNEGFAKPNNDAAKIATGDYLALINNDMKIDKNWLNDMFQTLDECPEGEYACVGSKIVNWNGTKLDFAGGSVSFAGYGYQFDFGMDAKEASQKYNKDKDILFACGGSLIINREVFLKIGGFDEDYFAYYEDVDLGWRLWILGYKVRFCSKAICYHKHNGTSKKFNTHKMKTLFERNALYTIYKNYSQENFDIVLCNLFLMIQRVQMDLKINASDYDITNKKEAFFEVDNTKDNYSSLIAINDLTDNLQKLNEKRHFIQNNRKIKDVDLKKLIPKPLMPFPVDYYHNYKYLDKFQSLLNTYDVEGKLQTKFRRQVLLISNEPIGKKMAGPGIRYLEFAKHLCKDNDVVLAVPNEIDLDKDAYHNIKFVEYELGNAGALIKAAWESDIIVLQGLILELVQELKEICKQKILVVDIYDPFVIEILETFKGKNINNRLNVHNQNLKIQLEQLELGDYFICANDKQMDMWIGMLTALNKVNPFEYNLSPKLEKLIDLVPFGISSDDPVHSKDAMKTKITNLKPNDKVLVWGGGIWNWFDPITLIKAVYEVSKERNDVKLFFMGVKHPNPAVPEMGMSLKAIKLAEELGIKDKYVFFNMDWVDYNDRQNYLLESFAGVSCHLDNLETRFSFRTRILDYLWAELPIIATEGDYFADLIKEKEIGVVVKYKDANSLKNAILKLADNSEFYKKCKDNLKVVREEYRWDVVMKPLVDFCNNPIKKKNATTYNNSNYIIDIEQEKQDNVVGQLVIGKRIGQKFQCRYPNLIAIDVKVATYARINDHKIKFKLYEASENQLLAQKEIEANTLVDNSWITMDFKPIINSEGREFYFCFEGCTEEYDNCITLWKNDKITDLGSIWENGKLLGGSLVYRTKCVYSKKPLDDKNGIVLEKLDHNSDDSIDDESFDDLTEIKGESSANVDALILKKLKRMQKLEKKVNKMEQSLNEKEIDINRISSWMESLDKRLRRLKKLNIVSFFKRIFRK